MPRFSNNAILSLPDEDFAIKFWSRFQRANVVPHGLVVPCLEWVGARTKKGYGNVAYLGSVRRTSRLAWAIVYGEWPPNELNVCHHCDNPPCGEVSHLFLGTTLDNVRDAESKGRRVPPPIMLGELHIGSKLTEAQIVLIRDRCASGEKQQTVATEMGVTQETISGIARGDTWKHIGGPRTVTELRDVRDLDGRPTTIKALALKYHLPYTALRRRFLREWDLVRALTQPVKADGRRIV